MRTAVALALLFAGCGCSDEKKHPGGDDTLPDCDPALAVDPAATTVRPRDILRLAASGGTGAYRFELVTNETGALVDARNGNYLAGESAGTDVVLVTDDGCVGSATATLTVGTPFSARPLEVELPPRGGFEYEVTGGSGVYECEVVVGESGGSVGGCHYTAGASEGDDVVAIRDAENGDELRGVVHVRDGATLRPDPPRIAFPVGQTWMLQIQGGSGVFDVSAAGGVVEVDGMTLDAAAVGEATVEVTDHFTAMTASIRADVVETETAEFQRAGDYWQWAVVLGPGDIDGDGSPDAVLALPEADFDASNSGAVYVYAGGPDGLAPEPVRTFTGRQAEAGMGRGVAIADFDGDGLLDLASGAPNYDIGGTDSGAVWIWRGTKGGFFEDEPWITLSGSAGWVWFGYGVAACDFDGDGATDLAVGSIYDEDRSVETPVLDQGAVHVFRGTADGFAPAPDVSIWGEVPDGEGGWVGRQSLRQGYTLAAADVDGDGLCDLVSGNLDYDSPVSNEAGAVHVYRGDADELVQTEPSLAWAGSDLNDGASQFGRNIAVGDLDGDGKAEIAASQYRFGMWRGAVRVFRGQEMSGTAGDYASAQAADFSWEGNADWDQFGWYPAIGDADLDGTMDLVTGNIADELLPEDWAGQGTIAVFSGSGASLPEGAPSRLVAGLVGGDAFGAAVATLGDVDGDGSGDLIGFAEYDSTLGYQVGRPYFVSGDGSAPAPLDMPGEPAGLAFASSIALVGDVDGDGREDLLAGAPNADPNLLANAGAAYLYLGRSGGFETEPSATYGAFPGADGWERFGTRVAGAGDFDADGHDDFAVLSQWDTPPATFDPARYVNPDECPGLRTETGAVYVFRGRASGVPTADPSFVWFGPGGGVPTALAGGFDVNGDGFGDFAVGMPWLDRGATQDVGGFSIVLGRAADPGGIVVLCDTGPFFRGLAWADWVGTSLAPLGDLDGDGCDELAVGAMYESYGTEYWEWEQGVVRIVFGWGATCARLEPEMVTLRSGQGSAYAGASIAGGGDVDGDGLPDLAVGAPWAWDKGAQVGAAWTVPGSYLLSLAREPIVDGQFPAETPTFSNGELGWRIAGRVQGEGFGTAVAFVPDAAPGGGDALAVGAPIADVPGIYRAGGVRVFAYQPGIGFDAATPFAAFGGETETLDGRAGDVLVAGTVGGRPTMVAGGSRMDAVCLDCGAAFTVDLGD